MKSIYFARHSFAESSYSGSDFERKITPKGFSRIEEQALLLNSLNTKIDHLISSQAMRAQETADQYKTLLNIQSKAVHYWLYESFLTQEFLEFIQQQNPKHQSIMIVGHNPTISFMASHFSHQKNYNFYPGAILKLDFEADTWSEIELRTGTESVYLK